MRGLSHISHEEPEGRRSPTHGGQVPPLLHDGLIRRTRINIQAETAVWHESRQPETHTRLYLPRDRKAGEYDRGHRLQPGIAKE